MPTNDEFLDALFKEHKQWVHVTDFNHDPDDIPDTRQRAVWKGDYYCRYRMTPGTNQYFTISLFYADEHDTARRRKALYRMTPVIVLDDVKEKLTLSEVQRLPAPSWIMETSPGSEQWGYILDQPCTDRHRVENLLDGLVTNGLAPNGKDPGMKGVTRYVRLPEGSNLKKSKMINGQPWRCHMQLWNPGNTVTIEQLAAPLAIDLDATRREGRLDGAATVNDHPLLDTDVVVVKEERSNGRFDVTCPWVDEHTGAIDNGAGVFTNADGTLGFKCHHGACQHRTGRDLINKIEEHDTGFRARLTHWQAMRAFETLPIAPPPPTMIPAPTAETNIGIPAPTAETNIGIPAPTAETSYQSLVDMLRTATPHSDQARTMAAHVLKSVDGLPAIDKQHLHTQVRDIMGWSKPDFKSILDDMRASWYAGSKDVNFYDDVVFIGEQNRFFDRRKRILYTAEAYQNVYSHLDPEARKEALQGGRVAKVDRVDYAPLHPPVFEEKGVLYANAWYQDEEIQGAEGDISRWLDHFKTLGWEKEMDHMIRWMAFTIRHPDIKINHMLLLGSGEGGGKDWLLYPLVTAMGENHTTIDGEELLSSFDDYKLTCKHLHVNEVELGDHREAVKISNKIKPLAAAPPAKLRVNDKGVRPIKVRNILNLSMTTNDSHKPLHIKGVSRRIFAVWSDINTRDHRDEMTPGWRTYWNDRWQWMKNGGAEACIWYLRNKVDLTGFNPGEAPAMTSFLRDISEASKSPLQQTIEAFINNQIGLLRSDIITANQINQTIRDSALMAAGYIYVDTRYITPIRIESTLKMMPLVRQVACAQGRLWILRRQELYVHMNNEELYAEYMEQVRKLKTINLTAVK